MPRKKTKKVKRLTKEQKKIQELEEELQNLAYSLNARTAELNRLKGEVETYKEFVKNIEGRKINEVEQTQWLRDTLRMVIVPVGREERLAKLIEQDRSEVLGYPVGRY